MNPDVDTIWLDNLGYNTETVCFPDDIEWFCGLCEANIKHESGYNCRAGVCGPLFVRCIAVNYSTWVKPGEGGYEMGTMERCFMNNVRELLLVVGEVDAHRNERDVEFVPPRDAPRWVKNTLAGWDTSHEDWGLSWPKLEAKMVQQMEDYKRSSAEERRLLVEAGHREDQIIEPMNVSQWVPPTVKFVESRTKSYNWVLPPRSQRPVQ